MLVPSFVAAALPLLSSMVAPGARADDVVLATVPEGHELDPGQPVVWSPTGERVGYVVFVGAKRHAVVGEEVGTKAYDFVEAPVFSDDGAHVAFRVGQRLADQREAWWPLLDGVEQDQEDWLGPLQFRPGTDELFFWTQPGAVAGGGGLDAPGGAFGKHPYRLCLDERRGEEWRDAPVLLPLQFSADGKVAGTLGLNKKGWQVILVGSRGEKVERQDFFFATHMALDPKGKEWAAVITGPPRGSPPAVQALIRHGRETWGEEYAGSGCPVFSPDGKLLAYKVESKAGKLGVALNGDGTARTPFDFVFTPVFAPDGKSLAFVANEGGQLPQVSKTYPRAEKELRGGTSFVVGLDRQGREIARGPAFAKIDHLIFAPSDEAGESPAYAALENGGWVVVWGERRSPIYDEIGKLRFAPSGDRIEFGARKGRQLQWCVLPRE